MTKKLCNNTNIHLDQTVADSSIQITTVRIHNHEDSRATV